MRVTLKVNQLLNSSGEELISCGSMDLWGCSQRGITSIEIDHVARGSKHRTLENAVKRDITGTYRVITISYDLLDTSRFRELKSVYDLQCDQLACLSLCIDNLCGTDCEGECGDAVSEFSGNVTMDLGKIDFTENGINGSFVEGLTVTFEESRSCNCSTCGG